ncbi:hypothetical protein OKW21_001752 [Catalinimonas alkaloidigena]|nr:hypothetical protein [Catalinimonas alkaloidigena]
MHAPNKEKRKGTLLYGFEGHTNCAATTFVSMFSNQLAVFRL